VCNISHGSVWAELVVLRKEEAEAKLKKQAEEKALTAGELFPGIKVALQPSNLQQENPLSAQSVPSPTS
jgi:hypothetical protein